MPLRVLYVNHVGMLGGAERSLLITLSHLDRTAVQPVLAAPRGDLLAAARAAGIETRWIQLGRVYRHGGGARRAASVLRLARAAASVFELSAGADLLHANSIAAALACVPAKVLTGKPLVWHVRDLQLPPPAVRLLARHATRAIAISSAVAERLRRAGMPPDRIELLPNTLDPATFQPGRERGAVRAELGLPERAQVLITVGQLVPWKGHEVLLQAVQRLAERWPWLHLLLVGEDLFGEHGEHVARLRAQAAPLGARVQWLGQRQDVADLMGAADILVLPSHGEPFGRVLLEAMAVGLPVVATTPGGPEDVVVAGQTGLLTPQGNAPAMAAAIEELLLDSERRAAYRAAGRRLLVKRFAPEPQARRLERLYTQLRTPR